MRRRILLGCWLNEKRAARILLKELRILHFLIVGEEMSNGAGTCKRVKVDHLLGILNKRHLFVLIQVPDERKVVETNLNYIIALLVALADVQIVLVDSLEAHTCSCGALVEILADVHPLELEYVLVLERWQLKVVKFDVLQLLQVKLPLLAFACEELLQVVKVDVAVAANHQEIFCCHVLKLIF